MSAKQYPDITISIIPNSTVYVFSIQARNPEGSASEALTIGQIEAARNAAAATLETIGAIIDSTASIVNVPASVAKAVLTLTPTVESTETVRDDQTDQTVEGVE